MKRAIFAFALSGLFGICAQATVSLQLAPSGGVVSGMPGSMVGWGFSLTNNADYLVVTGSSFVPASLYGTYQDYISTDNFIVVGPSPENTTVSQLFDPVALTGVGAFTIDSTAPDNISIGGNLVIDYSLFSQDPNNPAFDPGSLITADGVISAPAKVNITPEPAPVLLTIIGALALLASGRNRH